MKPIADTAYYCTGVRMLDARKKQPVCNDFYAHRFMDTHGKSVFKKFRYELFANSGNVVRHKIIDDFVKERFSTKEDIPVFIIGCGFDSRAFRIPGGIWTELDEAEIIEHKNEKLPITDCQNPLHRIAINFQEETISDKLTPYSSNECCLIIIEGVLLYLPEQEIRNLLNQLQSLFPKHILACDLMTSTFFNRYAKRMHRKLERLGASFQYIENSPEDRFKIQGYELKRRISIFKRAMKLNALPKIPDFLLNTYFESLRDGYAIYIMEYNQSTAD